MFTEIVTVEYLEQMNASPTILRGCHMLYITLQISIVNTTYSSANDPHPFLYDLPIGLDFIKCYLFSRNDPSSTTK